MAGLFLFAGPALAQSGSDSEAELPDPDARLRALNSEYMKLLTRIQVLNRQASAEAAKARAAGQPVPEPPEPPDLVPLVEKFEAAAADYAGTDDAVPFLIWLMSDGARMKAGIAKPAARTLAEQHADHPELRSLKRLLPQIKVMVGEEVGGKLLVAIRKQNDDKDLLGWVTLGEHAQTIAEAPLDSAEFATAKQILLALAEEARRPLRREITNMINMREKFGKGQQAPDIVGIDLDGTEFKLSDYRGKVIFLDFWGDW
ncbi:MAG: hypothetical protein VYE77_01385 [Planctomycetota bacterium]|nr:hypothetical protein [Planctomycetota bacterium]